MVVQYAGQAEVDGVGGRAALGVVEVVSAYHQLLLGQQGAALVVEGGGGDQGIAIQGRHLAAVVEHGLLGTEVERLSLNQPCLAGNVERLAVIQYRRQGGLELARDTRQNTTTVIDAIGINSEVVCLRDDATVPVVEPLAQRSGDTALAEQAAGGVVHRTAVDRQALLGADNAFAGVDQLLVGRKAHGIGGRDVAVKTVIKGVGYQRELALADQLAALLAERFGRGEDVSLTGDLALGVFNGHAIKGQGVFGGDLAAGVVEAGYVQAERVLAADHAISVFYRRRVQRLLAAAGERAFVSVVECAAEGGLDRTLTRQGAATVVQILRVKRQAGAG